MADPGATGKMAQVAVVGFVLIGFYTYPVFTIFFGKWPVMPSNLAQPNRGPGRDRWASLVTLFCYAVLIAPFFGLLFPGAAINPPCGRPSARPEHHPLRVRLVEWAIVTLFVTPERLADETVDGSADHPHAAVEGPAVHRPPFVAAYAIALPGGQLIPMWVPADTSTT